MVELISGCAFMQALSIEPSRHPAGAQQSSEIAAALAWHLPHGDNTLTPPFANDFLSFVDLCNNVPMS
ncbi:hypothetical protein LBW46_26500, partial [Ralstonia solanacearum]|uniref:hypothetical protein n=1 Tax=Ralstonia solanacearum TaxID=305 RepID=UPI002304F839